MFIIYVGKRKEKEDSARNCLRINLGNMDCFVYHKQTNFDLKSNETKNVV